MRTSIQTSPLISPLLGSVLKITLKKLILLLLSLFFLSACGGSSSHKPTKQFRLISIDVDKGANDAIDNKYYYEYDDKGNNTKIENINFNNKQLSITKKKHFDKKNKLIKITDNDTNPDPNKSQTSPLRQWTYTYNSSGRRNSEKFEDFEKQQYKYWVENKNIRTFYAKSGEIVLINRFSIDTSGNKLKELIDTNNNGKADKETNNTYNSDGKLLTKITTDLNSTNKAMLFKEIRTYDTQGNIISKTTFQPSKNTDKHLIKYQYIYDSNKNILTSSTIYNASSTDKTIDKNTDKRIYVWEEILPIAYFNNPINWAGTGCKAGSVSVSGAKTENLSILFDSYDAGKDAKSGLKRSACSFSIPIKIPTGYKISTLTADWEGYVEGIGELSRKYFLTGKPHKAWQRNTYNKPDGDNFTVRDNINNESLSANCNGGIYILRIDSQLKTSGGNSYAAIDSTDLHNKIQLSLQFRSCYER